MVYLEHIFLCNGKNSDNGGFYMTIITSDMIISKKEVNCYLRCQFKFIGLYLPE